MALLDLILDLIIAGQHTLAKKAWKKPKRLGQNKPSLWGGEKVDQKTSCLLRRAVHFIKSY